MNIEDIQAALHQLKRDSEEKIEAAEKTAEEKLNRERIKIVQDTKCLEGCIFEVEDIRDWSGEERSVSLRCYSDAAAKKISSLIKTGSFGDVSFPDNVDLYATSDALFLRIPISVLKHYIEIFKISISIEASQRSIKSMQKRIDTYTEIHASCEGHIV